MRTFRQALQPLASEQRSSGWRETGTDQGSWGRLADAGIAFLDCQTSFRPARQRQYSIDLKGNSRRGEDSGCRLAVPIFL